MGVDGIFWLAAGLPSLFILSRFHQLWLSFALYGSWIINGIGCVTLGSLLLYGWSLLEVRILDKEKSETIPLGTLLFNVVTLVVISLALLFYAMENSRFMNSYRDSIYSMLDREGEQMFRLLQRDPDASYSLYPMEMSSYAMAYVEKGILLRGERQGGFHSFQG